MGTSRSGNRSSLYLTFTEALRSTNWAVQNSRYHPTAASKEAKCIEVIGEPSGVEEPKMELYINSTWTKRYGNAYIAEAVAWSENGNHATIYAVGITAEEADAKLMGALHELKLTPEEAASKAKETIRPAMRSVCLKDALLSEGLDKGRWQRLAALWGTLNVPFCRS